MSETQEIKVGNMHCSNCASTVENHLKRLGLKNVAVDLSSETASFELPAELNLQEVKREIKNLGYAVIDENSSNWGEIIGGIKFKFFASLIFTFPLWLPMLVHLEFLLNPWTQLAFCLPVFILGAHHFGRSAINSLRVGLPNMDVLIIVGVIAAFAYSLVGIFLGRGHDFLFFETAASIVTLVFLGNLLEQASVKKTSSAIQDLTKMQASKALRIENGQTQEISYESIRIGDVLVAHKGSQVATDGVVISGKASLDESMLSGESLPVFKQEGDALVGGTLVADGNFQYRATAIGDGTVLASMVRLVKEAQRNKPSIHKLADQISAYFVPAVFVFALLTLLISNFLLELPFSESLIRAVAVLVISCPCAMGLATPTAVMVGLGRAARNGILIKGGDTLERLAQVKAFIFDKTGTLTTGDIRLAKISPQIGVDEDQVRALVYELERHSSHPIARSLTESLKNFSGRIVFESVREETGLGIFGRDSAGNNYALGSRMLLKNVIIDDAAVLFLTKNDELLATLYLEDTVRPEAKKVITALKGENLDTYLLSGDTQVRAERVARECGIDRAFGGQTPAAKLERIASLELSHPSAFIGDGINDGPALARAYVGISLSEASRVAVNSAQVVLLGNNLDRVILARSIAKETLLTIRQNLFWAFFYNVLAIPVAAAGFLSPGLAALAMALSDVMVIGNSLRLRVKFIPSL